MVLLVLHVSLPLLFIPSANNIVAPESHDCTQLQESAADVCTPTVNGHDYVAADNYIYDQTTTEDMLVVAQERIAALEAMQEKDILFIQLQMKSDTSIKFYFSGFFTQL